MTSKDRLPEADRRTVLRLVGTGALVGAVGSTPASAVEHPLDAEIEGPLQHVDVDDKEISVMGMTIDVSEAKITSPTTTLQRVSQLTGDEFPGRKQDGFIGGTVKGAGTTTKDGDLIKASSVFVEPAENVIFGPVTENSLEREEGETNEDAFKKGDTFEVQGTAVKIADDPRLTFGAFMEGSDFEVDVGTIPVESLASVEGYYGNDGVLYAHTLGAADGEIIGKFTNISRARCDDGELEIRGETSSPDGTITVYDDDTDAKLGNTEITVADNGTGLFRLRTELEYCPTNVRAENSDGSKDTAGVDT